MTVRLAFAVAAHLDSEILILDEVLAVGDIAFKNKCLAKVDGISRSEDKTVLFVSHDIATVLRLCKSSVVLEKGRVIFQGATQDGVALYLGQNEASSHNQMLEWTAPQKTMPFHEVISIRGYKILSNQNKVVSGTVKKSQNCRVEVELNLLSSDSRVVLGLSFFDADNDCVFVSDSLDAGLDNDFGKVSPGTYLLQVEIPDFLMDGDYSIELTSALHHTGWVLGPNTDSRMMFRYHRDEERNPYASDNRKGLVAPTLTWKRSQGGSSV
jgi:hypothetical protein